MRYSELLNTLQNLIQFKPTQGDIAKILGVGTSAITNRKTRDSEFTFEELRKIEDAYAILGGLTQNLIVNDSCVDLDYYPDVFASCGSGCVVFEENTEKISVTKDLINNYLPANKYSVIVARGRSNEPTIYDNDKLIVEHIENNSIIDNLLYVFSYEGQIYVKRLIKNIDEIVIVSDNPDKDTYRTQYVTKERMNEVKVIGKIVGLIREKV